ncbi:MAG: DUF1015 domain-containing protein [Spirochaetaceae bacterium]|nr:DUF1015 domain-containing protein [Spirochaetaceae bacterium]
MNIHERLAALGVAVPEILLPRAEDGLADWAVIACDQFTQDRAYWDRLDRTIGSAPSTLRLIYPEALLDSPDRADRIAAIHRAMKEYRAGDIFAPPRRSLVYLERATPAAARRRGLVIALDLERYEWDPASRPLIRSTEGTVPERLPPRMEIRRGAALETPHIIILIEDEEDALLPALGLIAKNEGAGLYDTPLHPASGRAAGWALEGDAGLECLASGLERLFERAKTRYGGEYRRTDGSPFLFAVGDGNHSLATAKAVWEEYKKVHTGEAGLERHPARWALVELENLYDPGIRFEPIHRLLTGFSGGAALQAMRELFAPLPGFTSRPVPGREELSRLVASQPAKGRFGLAAGREYVFAETDAPGLATGYLQPLLDSFIQRSRAESRAPGIDIDYIHGEEELFHLGEMPGNVGILLPPIPKNGLFETVAASGPLPRKSFSMGEAAEKRFYLECRRLFG